MDRKRPAGYQSRLVTGEPNLRPFARGFLVIVDHDYLHTCISHMTCFPLHQFLNVCDYLFFSYDSFNHIGNRVAVAGYVTLSRDLGTLSHNQPQLFARPAVGHDAFRLDLRTLLFTQLRCFVINTPEVLLCNRDIQMHIYLLTYLLTYFGGPITVKPFDGWTPNSVFKVTALLKSNISKDGFRMRVLLLPSVFLSNVLKDTRHIGRSAVARVCDVISLAFCGLRLMQTYPSVQHIVRQY